MKILGSFYSFNECSYIFRFWIDLYRPAHYPVKASRGLHNTVVGRKPQRDPTSCAHLDCHKLGRAVLGDVVVSRRSTYVCAMLRLVGSTGELAGSRCVLNI
jgi:hypothetical protein